MIQLTVDGRSVEVEPGTSVLKAARSAGVYVPTLCHDEFLTPFGGCRMCIVEIDGQRGFPASCTTPAAAGMVVRTDSEKVRTLRRGVLELLLSEHPSACLVCDDRARCWQDHETNRRAEVTTGCKFCPNHGQCELQQVVQHVSGDQGPIISITSRYRELPVDRRDPFIDRDDNLCILCGRCVRACEERSLTCTLDFVHRGSEARVGTAFNRTLLDSGCSFCGACVDVCPTGTLSERVRRWEGPAEDHVPTTCSFCSVGCQFDLGVKSGRVIESLARRGSEINDGDACVRGRFAVVEFTRSVRRLKRPLVRRHGELLEVPWKTALQAVVEGIRRSQAEKSAIVYSGSCTNEDIFTLHRFARDVLRTSHVDCGLRLSYGPLLDPAGAGGPVARLSDLDQAGAVLVIGAEPELSHPVLAQKIKRSVNAGRLRLVTMGTKATGLSGYATCEIRHLPGEGRGLLEQLGRALGGHDGAALPEEVARAAAILASAKPEGAVVVVYGTGLMRGGEAAGDRDLVAEVAKAASAKLLPLLSRANDRGALEIARSFGSAGMTVPEIFLAVREGRMDLLYLIGEDVWPGCEGAGFVVVQDMFLPAEAGRIADVVLPSASFTEIDGTYTNLEGRIQRLRRAVEPTGVAKPDWEILSLLTGELGRSGFEFEQASQVMDELAKSVPFYKGASYRALEKEGSWFGRSREWSRGRVETKAKAVRTSRSAAARAEDPFSLVAEFSEFSYKGTRLGSEVRGIRRLEVAGVPTGVGHAETPGIEAGLPVEVVSRSSGASADAVRVERL